MKYSLRSLMIVVTLMAAVLGGRIEYLRRWAVSHEQAAEQSGSNDLEWDDHHFAGQRYRLAMWRPWTIVDEMPMYREHYTPKKRAP